MVNCWVTLFSIEPQLMSECSFVKPGAKFDKDTEKSKMSLRKRIRTVHKLLYWLKFPRYNQLNLTLNFPEGMLKLRK